MVQPMAGLSLRRCNMITAMRFTIRNQHSREFHAPAKDVGSLIDSLAGENDRLWPGHLWPAMRFDRALSEGAVGGHGPIRYRVDSFQPGKTITFRFTPDNRLLEANGTHSITVEGNDSQSMLWHRLEGSVKIGGLLKWLIVVRPLHDALIEDAFDKAEMSLHSSDSPGSTHSLWVRTLRQLLNRRRHRPISNQVA